MRIAYLLGSSGEGVGGLEKHVLELSAAMAMQGYDVFLVAHPYYAVHCPSNVEFVSFQWQRSRKSPLLWLHLRRCLRLIAPDLVHAHASKAVRALSMSGWSKFVATVGTVHGLKKGYAGYEKMDAVIVVSEHLQAQLNHPRLYVIKNGVYPRQPDPVELAKIQTISADWPRPIVLAAGRLAEVKGYCDLLEAWPLDVAGTLVILGEGGQRSELESIKRDRGLAHVHLPGETVHVREWMTCAEIFVISSHREGGPYVLVEALQAGLPVISTAVGMAREILPKDWLLPPGDITAMAVRLREVISAPEIALDKCRSAMTLCNSELTLNAMVEATQKVYETLTVATQRGL